MMMIATRWRRRKPCGGCEGAASSFFSITTCSPDFGLAPGRAGPGSLPGMAFQSSHCIDARDATFIVTATGHSNSSGGGKAKLSHAKRHVTLTRCGAGSFRGSVVWLSCVLMRSNPLTRARRSGLSAGAARAPSRFLKISHGSFGGDTEEAGQIRSGASLDSRAGGRCCGGGDAAAFLARPSPVASLMRCASPPQSPVAGCPSRR
jgi:hypothetical protein